MLQQAQGAVDKALDQNFIDQKSAESAARFQELKSGGLNFGGELVPVAVCSLNQRRVLFLLEWGISADSTTLLCSFDTSWKNLGTSRLERERSHFADATDVPDAFEFLGGHLPAQQAIVGRDKIVGFQEIAQF